MLFSIFAYDVEDSLALRQQARPAHIARLESLDQAGRLVLAGPNPNLEGEGFSGSLIVAEFDNIEQADQWANEDPYLSAGVYDRVEVKPFKQVFPKT
ncbi:YciI family protein [Thiomicrospira microaerophila]|uniref:YciI family protein n=1 Tax=Thiomicrospira microaerophila TaxID=406020 RepID=UPI00200E4CC5|nr:YciI family protein [Thiomicrospira microaerophila]UQB41327.1 YciI family protein [Thiomicrospira microaerophila]